LQKSTLILDIFAWIYRIVNIYSVIYLFYEIGFHDLQKLQRFCYNYRNVPVLQKKYLQFIYEIEPWWEFLVQEGGNYAHFCCNKITITEFTQKCVIIHYRYHILRTTAQWVWIITDFYAILRNTELPLSNFTEECVMMYYAYSKLRIYANFGNASA